MAGFSDYLENLILNAIFSGTAFPSFSTCYISLHIGDPGDTGINELTGGGYARQLASFGPASTGVVANDITVEFANLPESTISYWGVWSAPSGGNPLFLGSLTSARNVTAGDNLLFALGQLTITLT